VDELQELEQLLRELMQGIQAVLQSGEMLSDQFQGQLAQTLELLVNRIDQLQAENPTEDLQPIQTQPQLNESMPSSNIESFGYDNKNGNLLVRFLGDYPNREGPTYAYSGIPRQIFDLFQKGAIPARTNGKNKWGKWWKGKTPSIGASMYTLIKGGAYPYQRIG